MKFPRHWFMRTGGSAPATPASGLLAVYSTDGLILLTKDSAGTVKAIDASLENFTFHHAGAVTTGTGVMQVPIKGGTFNIISVAARAQTAPTGASLIVDVNKNGSTIYGTQANRPTIAASANNATVGAHTATTVTDGDYLSVDIDQVGSTVAGSNLVVVIRIQRVS